MNKSSSLLLQLYLHLLHFLIMNKSSYFKKKKKKKNSKRALGLRALGSYFLGCFKKKKKSPIKIFNSLKKFKISKLKKKKLQKFQFLRKIQVFKKKKKKSSLNSSLGTESSSSSIFSTGATSSQLSTLSIL